MDNILLLNNQKLIVAEFNISINETTKFIISFRFGHKWQIQKVLNYSFLISIQSIFKEEVESMLRKIQGLLEKFVDTGIYGKMTVYFERKRMFYQMTVYPKSR